MVTLSLSWSRPIRSVSPDPGRRGRDFKNVTAEDLEKLPRDDPKNIKCIGGFTPSGVEGIEDSGSEAASLVIEPLEVGEETRSETIVSLVEVEKVSERCLLSRPPCSIYLRPSS